MGGGLTKAQRRARQRAKQAALNAVQQNALPTQEVSPPPTPALAPLPLHDRLSANLGRFLGNATAAFVVPIVAAFTVSAFAAAGIIDMTVARVFLGLAFIFSAAGLIVFAARVFAKHSRWISLVLVLASAAAFFVVDKVIDTMKPEDPYKGELVAGNKPMQDITCSGADKARFLVRFGALTGLVSTLPRTLITICGKDVLRIDSPDNRRMQVHAEIYDPQNKVIAIIDKNAFQINQNNIFRKERPDKSSLVIYDQYNERVLDIEYRNEREITINGTLWYYSGIKLLPDALIVSGGTQVNMPGGVCLLQQLNIN